MGIVGSLSGNRKAVTAVLAVAAGALSHLDVAGTTPER
jgi:hypothetical protein